MAGLATRCVNQQEPWAHSSLSMGGVRVIRIDFDVSEMFHILCFIFKCSISYARLLHNMKRGVLFCSTKYVLDISPR